MYTYRRTHSLLCIGSGLYILTINKFNLFSSSAQSLLYVHTYLHTPILHHITSTTSTKYNITFDVNFCPHIVLICARLYS